MAESADALYIGPWPLCFHMKLDVQTIRAIGRVTDRMDAIRKNPHRYDVTPDVHKEIAAQTKALEELLAKVTVLRAG